MPLWLITRALVGMMNDFRDPGIVNLTCAYMPGSSEPSRLSTCTSVSIVRAASSRELAVRAMVPAYSLPRHREDNGERHRGEEILGWSGEEHNGNKNNADCQGGNERGRRDFGSADEYRVSQRFIAHVPVDVLDRHRCVIHQN